MREFNKEDNGHFLKIKKEFEPLIKSLSAKVNYKKMGFTYEDIKSMYDEKLLKLFIRYHHKEPDDFKYLVIGSLKNLSTKIWAQVPENTLRIEDSELEFIIPHYDDPNTADVMVKLFIEFVKPQLTHTEFTIFHICTWPPLYIINQVKDITKRIPSQVLLEYFEKPINKYNVKTLNIIRRRVEDKVESLIPKFRLTIA